MHGRLNNSVPESAPNNQVQNTELRTPMMGSMTRPNIGARRVTLGTAKKNGNEHKLAHT
jgi:hypothetical protein